MSDRSRVGGEQLMDTIHRLRQVQEDFADEPVDVRHQHLREEVERALTHLAPDQRERFLDELLRRVPWSSGNGAVAHTPPPTRHSAVKEEDPDQLATRLAEQWRELDQSARDRITARLVKHGVVPGTDGTDGGGRGGGADLSQEQLDKLSRQLRLRRDTPIQMDRVLELILELLPYIHRSSQVSLRIWRDFSSGLGTTAGQTPPDPQKVFQQYVTGDDKVSQEQVKSCIEQNQKLIGSLLQALNVLSRVAGQINERYSIEKIERMAKLEQRNENIFKRKPFGEACWNTFKNIAEKHDEHSLEREMKRQIAEYVEDYLRPH